MSDGIYYVIGDIKRGSSYRGQHAVLKHIAAKINVTQPEILYLGAACNNEPKPKYGFIGGMKKLFPAGNVTSVSLSVDHDNLEFDKKLLPIECSFERADLIYFDGGDVFTLKSVFDRFKLKEMCANAFKRGAAVGGMCGGGSFLADEVIHYDVQSGSFSRDIGARLLPNIGISCHMDRTDEFDERYQQLKNISYSGTQTAIGLGADQAVIFDGFNQYSFVQERNNNPPFQVDSTGKLVPLPICSLS